MTKGYYGTSINTHPHGGTPDWLLHELENKYGEMFDPCPNNPTFDGLSISWQAEKQTVFVNPPYTRGEIEKWVKKCSDEFYNALERYYKEGKAENLPRVVLLIPSYTDTRYFHEYIYNQDYTTIQFIEGRLKFKGYENKASFPSMLVTWEVNFFGN